MQAQKQKFLYEISAERQRSKGFLRNFFNKLFHECSQDEVRFNRFQARLEALSDIWCGSNLEKVSSELRVDSKNLKFCRIVEAARQGSPVEPYRADSATLQNFSFFGSASDSRNTSKLNPHQMSLNASIDLVLLPIQTNEDEREYCSSRPTILTRRCGRQPQAFYVRNDYCGKIARLRQLLYVPMTELGSIHVLVTIVCAVILSLWSDCSGLDAHWSMVCSCCWRCLPDKFDFFENSCLGSNCLTLINFG